MRPGIALVAVMGVGLALFAGTSGACRVVQIQSAAQPPQLAATITPSQTWSFQIDEATLTRDMNAWADLQPRFQTPVGGVRLYDLSAQLHTDQLIVEGNAEVGGMTAPLRLSANAAMESGRAVVHIQEARLGTADLPDSTRGELQRRLQDQIDQATATFHVVVESISLGEDTLVVRGMRQ